MSANRNRKVRPHTLSISSSTVRPTPTLALKKGSPCINRGSNPDNLATDQRGLPFKRKAGGAVNIGAFERQ